MAISPTSTPEISVVVPVYNVERYIKRCIDSIVGQTFTNIEIIVVDDCSPDSSLAICKELAKKDRRIKIISAPYNIGLSGARNLGIKNARGAYISLIDADDWVPINFLEQLLHSLRESNSDFSACKVVKTWKEDPDTLSPQYDDSLQDVVLKRDEALIDVLTSLKRLGPTAWNKLYKKELFDDIEYPVGYLHEDALTTYKIANKATRAVYTTQTCYYYFQRRDSIMRGSFNKKRLEALEHLSEIDNYLQPAGDDLKQAVDFYKYSFHVGLVDDMLGDGSVKQQRRKLMRQMASWRSRLWHNPYASLGVRFSLALLRWPVLHEGLKHFRRDLIRRREAQR